MQREQKRLRFVSEGWARKKEMSGADDAKSHLHRRKPERPEGRSSQQAACLTFNGQFARGSVQSRSFVLFLQDGQVVVRNLQDDAGHRRGVLVAEARLGPVAGL